MNEQEIHRIRKKFILLSTLSFFGVMLFMGSCIFLFSMFAVRNEVHLVMNYIVENDGELPIPDVSAPEPGTPVSVDSGIPDSPASPGGSTAVPDDEEGNSSFSYQQPPRENIGWSLRRIFGIGDITGQTADSFYSTRYFAVLFDTDGEAEKVITSHIASIDEETAEHYAQIVLQNQKRFGSFGRYYYHIAERKTGGTIVIYLDRSAQLTDIYRILFIALLLLIIGTLLAYHFMRIFSREVVRSEIESVERQKQFITNASHELKTPLAVIRANTEMQEMLEGETEWTRSTMRQADRLNGLVQNLVQIARAQETATGELSVMNIAPAVSDTAESFAAVAAGDGKTLTHKITPSAFMEADESMIRQLVSLLADNAVKYCDPNGEIRIVLSRTVRTITLTVSNAYADGASVDYTRFFERFYREDEARTAESTGTSEKDTKNGYGIGLSIVEELVRSLHGTIHVSWKNGIISFVCRFRTASTQHASAQTQRASELHTAASPQDSSSS